MILTPLPMMTPARHVSMTVPVVVVPTLAILLVLRWKVHDKAG